MTSINQKLGLRPAGKRAMMNLPKARAEAAAVTSAKCPRCLRVGRAKVSATKGAGWLYCTWCNELWQTTASPPSVDAVDPHASDPGTRSTREKKEQ